MWCRQHRGTLHARSVRAQGLAGGGAQGNGGDEDDDNGDESSAFAATRRQAEQRMARHRTRVDYFPLQVIPNVDKIGIGRKTRGGRCVHGRVARAPQ